MYEDRIREAAELLFQSTYAIAFTGAGVSAESGIPTFRDPGGLWDRFSPEEFATPQGIITTFRTKPRRFLEFLKSSIEVFERAKPNEGHKALAKLEEAGIIKTVITQNIDWLHQEAGSRNVIEVHGTITRFSCISCGRNYQKTKKEAIDIAKKFLERLERAIEQGDLMSAFDMIEIRCPECNGILRPDVVLFTEPVKDMNTAFAEAQCSDCVLVAGTSGVVYPAAAVPEVAKRYGAKIIEINPTGQYFDSDVWIPLPFAQAMPRVAEEVLKKVV